MNCTNSIVAAGFALAVTLLAAPVQAQNNRSFVSPTGSDSNPCSLAAPCRSFAGALAVTNAGGEIAVLGTAGYGTVIVNKPVSIVNPGAFEAGVTIPSGGTGITVNTPGSVKLQGLTLEGSGTGSIGIDIQAVDHILIDNCRIYDLTGTGILFEPAIASGAVVGLGVKETLISDTGTGIWVVPSGTGNGQATMHDVVVRDDLNGILVDGRSSSGKVLSVLSATGVHGGSTVGLEVVSAGTFTDAMVVRSVITGNVVGIAAQGTNANLWIGQSVVSNNENGWEAISSGTVQSYGTNQINGNAANQTQVPVVTGGSN
jgi:Right handed beta helix region